MKSNFKSVFVCAALALIILHFSLVLIFVNPFKVENKLTFYSSIYVYPFFEQAWKLFAPVPSSNYKLFVEYSIDNKIFKKDLLQHIQNIHAQNRFSGYESLALALYNSIFQFEKNYPSPKNFNGPIKENLNFKIVQHLVSQYLQDFHQHRITNLKIILLVNDIKSKMRKVYFN